MFSQRGLFLVLIISLTSIVLADVLVQPGYGQPNSNTHFSVPQQKLSGFQAVYPYYASPQNIGRSHLVSYSHHLPYHHHHYHYSRPNKLHFAKIGGHGYTRPSMYVGYRPPLVVHHRYRRSLTPDSTSTESSKSEVVTHDNDVAAKSPLTDSEHSTTNDSLLPEHEPTDSNDKHVENRQIPDLWFNKPHLFGLDPTMMSSLIQSPSTEDQNQETFLRFPEYKQAQQTTTSQENCGCPESNFRIITNEPSARVNSPPVVMEKPAEETPYYPGKPRSAWYFSPISAPKVTWPVVVDHTHESDRYTQQPYTIWRLPTKITPEATHVADISLRRDLNKKTVQDILYDIEENTGEMRAAQEELENNSWKDMNTMNIANLRQHQDNPKQNQTKIKSFLFVVPLPPEINEIVRPTLHYYPTYYRSNNELSGTQEIVNTPSARNILPRKNIFANTLSSSEFNPPNYDYNYVLNKFWNQNPLNTDFSEYKDYNLPDISSIEPNDVIYTNIDTQGNMLTQQRQMQFLDDRL
ncbi:uncharacterized protein LOC105208055 isoform X2 [Solenopsis invicta]|uniref:uncharacterized protein LOC105208055 isoform X2 n=1 Tax=Solenopsis invicta TaxID=13686 RepID=UPI0005962A6C|nr:uncharacterized protein LOC105208055 isoform X2 [Solenopsis invicta]